jgi:hypothetical protein
MEEGWQVSAAAIKSDKRSFGFLIIFVLFKFFLQIYA